MVLLLIALLMHLVRMHVGTFQVKKRKAANQMDDIRVILHEEVPASRDCVIDLTEGVHFILPLAFPLQC